MFAISLIMTIIMCATMILCGLLFIKHPPKDINGIYGYRTSMSSKNQQTWDFAHRYSGRVWLFSGVITLLLSLIIIFVFKAAFSDKNSMSVMWLMIFQCVMLLLVIPLTESELKKRFDKNGKPKDN